MNVLLIIVTVNCFICLLITSVYFILFQYFIAEKISLKFLFSAVFMTLIARTLLVNKK